MNVPCVKVDGISYIQTFFDEATADETKSMKLTPLLRANEATHDGVSLFFFSFETQGQLCSNLNARIRMWAHVWRPRNTVHRYMYV